MPQSTTDMPDLIGQLQHKSSPKRRAAAKKLRKLKAKEAGPALLAALKIELKDKRTWETQYQMIMALGESGYTECLEFLTQLADQEFEATMVYIAIGDSIGRLTYLSQSNVYEAIKYVLNKNHNALLSDGILRAIAMQKIIPDEEGINQLLTFAEDSSTPDNNRTWIVSASAGWHKNKRTAPFLNKHIHSENSQTKKAAEAALNKKYIKWSIL